MTEPTQPTPIRAIIAPDGSIAHIGLYPNASDCWYIFTGWGEPKDNQYWIDQGYRCSEVTVTEVKSASPTNQPDNRNGSPEEGDRP